LIIDLASKYGKTAGQIILNWHLHRGHILIPKTSKIGRLRENIVVFDFNLSEDEYSAITKLDKRARFYDPLLCKGLKAWNYWPYWHE